MFAEILPVLPSVCHGKQVEKSCRCHHDPVNKVDIPSNREDGIREKRPVPTLGMQEQEHSFPSGLSSSELPEFSHEEPSGSSEEFYKAGL